MAGRFPSKMLLTSELFVVLWNIGWPHDVGRHGARRDCDER